MIIVYLFFQKDAQSPFVQTAHSHPGFTPQKVGKNTNVYILCLILHKITIVASLIRCINLDLFEIYLRKSDFIY